MRMGDSVDEVIYKAHLQCWWCWFCAGTMRFGARFRYRRSKDYFTGSVRWHCLHMRNASTSSLPSLPTL